MSRTSLSDTGNPLADAVKRSIKEARQSLTEIQQKIDDGTLSTTTFPNFSANPILGMNAANNASANASTNTTATAINTPLPTLFSGGNGSLNGGLTADQFVSQSNTGNWQGFGLNPATGFLPVSGFNGAAVTGNTQNASMFSSLQGAALSQGTPPPILQLQQTLLGLLSLLAFPYMSQNSNFMAAPTAPTITGAPAGKQNAVTTLQKVLTVSDTEKANSAALNPDGDMTAVSQDDVNTLNQSLKTGQFSQNNLASALQDGLATDNAEALDEIAVLTGQLVDQGVLDPELLLNENSLQGMDELGLGALSQGLANAGIWKSDKTVNRSLSDWLQANLGGNILNNPNPAQRAFAQRLTRDTLNAWQGYYDTPEGQYLQNFLSTRLGLKLTASSTDPTSLTIAPDNEQPFLLSDTAARTV